MNDIYDFECKLNNGELKPLADYKNEVLLIVNTASQCGFTNQYKGLEALYKTYHDKGFQVLGFPCNQFGSQEPGADSDIASFCDLNYGVSFPLFSKVDVNGDSTAPLYAYLKEQAKGIIGTQTIKWNFTKFLVNREGKVLKRFAPKDKPEAIEKEIKALLS